jgi:hypothetical protein
MVSLVQEEKPREQECQAGRAGLRKIQELQPAPIS